jgi:hypothetical protein
VFSYYSPDSALLSFLCSGEWAGRLSKHETCLSGVGRTLWLAGMWVAERASIYEERRGEMRWKEIVPFMAFRVQG